MKFKNILKLINFFNFSNEMFTDTKKINFFYFLKFMQKKEKLEKSLNLLKSIINK